MDETTQYVFGPVPSRRLGRSLGIDPIPFKTCNWNCVYCQLGRTSQPTNQRDDYVPVEDVVSQVEAAVAHHGVDGIDWLTFVGSGEPTLHARLGDMIHQLKSRIPIPIAVITNGALLSDADVRRALHEADVVMPTVDAGNETLYRRINRSVAELTFQRLVDGLVTFRAGYPGRLWVEVMLIAGLNDSEPALRELAAVLDRISPDEVHLNMPIRPPNEPWVAPPDEATLLRAASILGAVAQVIHPVEERTLEIAQHGTVVDAILAVIRRHPMRDDEVVSTLGRWEPERVREALEELRQSGRAQTVERQGQRFWSSAEAGYADAATHRCRGRTEH